MQENLQWRITPFFDYWRKRHAFICDLDLSEYSHEANVLLWAAIDALSNLWAENIGKEQCKEKKSQRIIFDAFLARYGGEVFQIVSLPDVWNRADDEIKKKEKNCNEHIYKFLSTIGGRRNPTLTDEYIIRQISDDLSMDEIVSATLLNYPETNSDKLKEWLTWSRYGAIAYKEMRSKYIHEGRSGKNSHGFKFPESAKKPTYLSGIYTTPRSMGFALEFMLPVLKSCIDAFEDEALKLQKDPAPYNR